MNPIPAADYLVPVAFLLSVGAVVGGGLLAVFTRWIIRSVCGLALASVGLAGLFYFLQSPFLAMIHILIYIGAVCITIVFAIMLAEPDEPAEAQDKPTGPWTLASVAVSAGVLAALVLAVSTGPWPKGEALAASGSSVEAIGVALLSSQGLALQMTALVLLVSILGALAIARKGRHLE